MNDSSASREAVAALRRIARNEKYKAAVLNAPVLRYALLKAVSRFIGREELAQCLEVASRFHREGIATAIDYMGESTRDPERAAQVTHEFLRVLEALAEQGNAASISPDLSHLGMSVDPQLAYENATSLARAARDAGTEVILNMEGSDRTETILQLHRRLCERWDHASVLPLPH